jgi:hypothetical protein
MNNILQRAALIITQINSISQLVEFFSGADVGGICSHEVASSWTLASGKTSGLNWIGIVARIS